MYRGLVGVATPKLQTKVRVKEANQLLVWW